MKNVYAITGASSGIGYELCCHLASRDKNVVAIARRSDRLRALQEQYPERITTFKADLSTPSDRNAVAEHLSTTKILGLVNNAATNDPISVLENLNLEAWHRQIAINLDAPIFLTQALLPFLKGGRVMNLTTGTTNFIISGVAGYAITKAAINVFTKYLSDELRSKDILVTAAHPGIVKTELHESVVQHGDPSLGVSKAQDRLEKENKYLDMNVSVKFLCWLLLDADNSLYTGDIIGVYNKKYQPLWHDKEIPSPYPDNIEPP